MDDEQRDDWCVTSDGQRDGLVGALGSSTIGLRDDCKGLILRQLQGLNLIGFGKFEVLSCLSTSLYLRHMRIFECGAVSWPVRAGGRA